jgi:hypothetical protein
MRKTDGNVRLSSKNSLDPFRIGSLTHEIAVLLLLKFGWNGEPLQRELKRRIRGKWSCASRQALIRQADSRAFSNGVTVT